MSKLGMGILLTGSVLIMLFTNGCGKWPSDEYDYLKKNLTNRSSQMASYEYDFNLFNRAVLMDIDELLALEDEIIVVIDRDGLEPIASFLIHYLERLYFGQPPGWEAVAKRIIDKAKSRGDIEKEDDEARTIGIIDYYYPMKIKVYSLQTFNLFIYFADTDFGRSFLMTGEGADKMIDLLLLMGQNCGKLQSLETHGDVMAEKMKGLFNEVINIYDICGTGDGHGGGHGEISKPFGLKDAFTACVKNESNEGIAYAQRVIEAFERCMDARLNQETDRLAKGGKKKTKKEKIKDAEKDTKQAKENKEKATAKVKELSSGGKQVIELEKGAAAAGKAEADAKLAEADAEVKVAEAEWREAKAKGDKTGMAKAEEKIKSSTKNYYKTKGNKNMPYDGLTPEECMPEKLHGVKDKHDEIMAIFGFEEIDPDNPKPPKPNPLVSYFIDDPGDEWFITGCGALLFAMDDGMTQCMRGVVKPCAWTDPMPGDPVDYCACAEKFKSKTTSQAETLEYLGIKNGCTEMYCEEGYECVNGKCQPIVQEQCGNPKIPGVNPDPFTGVSESLDPLEDCFRGGIRPVTFEEIKNTLLTDGINIDDLRDKIVNLKNLRLGLPPNITNPNPDN
ncbi:MAG: hypothetical protein ABIE07_09485 [Candidatus Zixiibacteriota bacterium]